MTVSANNSRLSYNGNGATVAFSAPYFLASADLKVYVGGVLKTLTTDYSVSGAGVSSGGTVTFVAAPPAGTGNVVILRDPDQLQAMQLPSNDPFPSKAVETALDKLTMLVQRGRDLLSRALVLSDSDTSGTPTTLPDLSNRNNKVLGFDSAGNFTVFSPVDNTLLSVDLADYSDMNKGAALIGGVGRVVDSVAALKALPKTGAKRAFVLGYYAAGDGGGGAYYYDSSDTTSADNGGTIIVAGDGARWKLANVLHLSVKQFGAKGDGVTNDTAAFIAAANAVDALGGGRVWIPPGAYATPTGLTFGNGSNSANSTIHNRVVFCGAGSGSSSGVTNQEINGVSRILYTGSANASAAVVSFAGPLHSVGLEDMALDCNSLAGIGVLINHCTQSNFRNVVCRNYTAIGWSLTTRTGFPSGCAFGCADNRFIACYGFVDSSVGTGTVLGISLNSGVSTGTSLAGQPDSARNVFIGGTFMYGQSATSYGAWLSGADNNSMLEVEFYPYNGSTSGLDVYLQQWPASGAFPLENYFANLGMTKGVGGNGGVGSSNGNTFIPFPTSDGASMPAVSGASGITHLGQTFVAGVQAYRGRQVSNATLNSSVQSNSTGVLTNVPGLSVTLTVQANTKLRVSFSGRASKSTAASGYFQLALNGSAQGDTRTDVNSDGYWHAVSAEGLYSVGAGSQTITVQFASSDTNAIQISHGTLVVQELY